MIEANPGASPVSRAHRRSHSLEKRLFAWLLGVALVPTLLLLATGTWLGAGSIAWLTGVGPWDRVARSGRALVEAAARDSAADPVLAAAARRHRDQLAESLVLARRWSFVGQRLSRLLPLAALGLAALLAGLALAVSRRLARDLARPIAELVEWTERIGREEPLPPPSPAEEREVREVRRLRAAARRAAAELGEARRRALEAERVRIWGEMARRVAHEMKNPLTPLRLAAYRLQAEGGAANGEPLAVIHEETARLEELAREFAALGRPPDGPTSPVDLPELLGSLLATDVPPTIEARLEVTGSVPLVEAHYEALVRAFRNLIRNAADAVDVTGPPGRITVGVSADADGVRVRIEDTGPGLPDGGERIFEPEFTTKARGTGLGLAIVRQAVVAHGGQVRAWTRAEGGATFEVCLPPAPAPQMEARA